MRITLVRKTTPSVSRTVARKTAPSVRITLARKAAPAARRTLSLAMLALLALVTVGLGRPSLASAAPPAMTRAEIMERAGYGVGYSYWWGHGCWRTDGQSLGSCSGSCPSCTHSGSYGADCSGYVAKAWQVPNAIALTQDAHPYSTYNFRWETTWWNQVAWGSAQLADAFVYRNSENTGGHIILYESGDPWGSIWSLEAKGCSYGIVRNLKQLTTAYVAIRRVNLEEAPQTGVLLGVVFEDLGVGSADMSVRIPGAEVSCAGEGTTTAGSPDADWSFTLPAGSYTVTASAAGYEPGTRDCQVTSGQDSWCSIGLFSLCTPDCSGRQCGLDPVCGEPCGSCPQGEVCRPDGQCLELTGCALDCTDRDCGPDPVCGEPCGVCPSQFMCDEALGVCVTIQAGDAKIYGYVVAVPRGATQPLHVYPPVPGATVSLDGEPVRETDRFGYYELMVEAGSYRVGAEAEGYEAGETECAVANRGYVECLVPVFESESIPQDPDPDALPTGSGIELYRAGCEGCQVGAEADGSSGTLPVILLCLVLGLLWLRAFSRKTGSG